MVYFNKHNKLYFSINNKWYFSFIFSHFEMGVRGQVAVVAHVGLLLLFCVRHCHAKLLEGVGPIEIAMFVAESCLSPTFENHCLEEGIEGILATPSKTLAWPDPVFLASNHESSQPRHLVERLAFVVWGFRVCRSCSASGEQIVSPCDGHQHHSTLTMLVQKANFRIVQLF